MKKPKMAIILYNSYNKIYFLRLNHYEMHVIFIIFIFIYLYLIIINFLLINVIIMNYIFIN